MLTIRPATPADLPRLPELFDYNDVPGMIAANTRRITSGKHSIFLLLEDDELIGELHVTWRSADPLIAIDGQRAYLSAFRIREDKQGVGYGSFLLDAIIRMIDQGMFQDSTHQGIYREITVGVEDDNPRARHMYEKRGFTQRIARCRESYQDDEYEFDLLLRQR
ncbi:MAG: GNAT family N-acetyltransferase [Clostridia bacterium]|nr:GNAT family N-acetyltransferase [Clostridia bacterium]